MKVVIAPDSFKETLSAAEVAEALAEGVLAACPDARVDLCPMADGGEGTVEAMVAATGGEFCTADVFDPLGAPIRARFGLLGEAVGAGLPGEVGLSAARGGDVVGEHQVMFLGNGEQLILIHRATSREHFCRGALEAVRFAAGQEPGRYGMADVF